MGTRLVIVESPAKGKTIEKYLKALGEDCVVRASMGHIRDLPGNASQIPEKLKKEKWARLGVNVKEGFRPLYVVPDEKKKHVRDLKKDLKGKSELLLATDEDREGESISWHLVQELKPKVPVKRMVFHEITKEAILGALEHTRDIDENLVKAQEARRIVDRLFGYEVSPILWKKVKPKLSAGRVQSVAVRMVVDREKARIAFRASEYWDLAAEFAVEAGSFGAALTSVEGQRVASGRDFDSATGRLKTKNVLHLGPDAAQALAKRLRDATFEVSRVETKPFTQRPSPPFTTSTLQQEGGRKLGWTARRTMQVAQSLYENGFITYMRTDSTNLSQQAVKAARTAVQSMYGADYLPGKPRSFATKVKNAQEAHEAIRPAGERFRTPEEVASKLQSEQRRLYELIWKRTMASQMTNARGERVSAVIAGGGAEFSASGKSILFPGYLRAYVEGSDDPDAELADKETLLPVMRQGEAAEASSIKAKDHRTQPPPRLTEAALVKALEGSGVGRPSTYASIIDTIERREYTYKKGNTLIPTWTAFAVVKLLEEHFPDLVDLAYTARLEDDLDAISRGEGEAATYLGRFYFGDEGDDEHLGLHRQLAEKTDQIDARSVCTIGLGLDPEDREISVRIGRYGPYLERGEERANMPDGLAPDELSIEMATEFLNTPQGPRELGAHPETGQLVTVRTGRFGPYVQMAAPDGEKPKSVSLLKGMSPEAIDLDLAVSLLQLPRTVGQDADGVDIVANVGPYGPYIKRDKDTRSLEESDSVLTVTRARALELLAKEKKGRRRRGSVEPLKTFAKVAALDGADIRLMPGRFGPYVTDGTTNASLARGSEPEELTPEQAANLILERRARGPAKKKKTAKKARAKKKKAGSKKPARKTAAKKKTAKKKTAKKKATRRKAAARKSAPKKKAARKAPAARKS